MKSFIANISDEAFKNDPRAVLVCGFYWQDFISQFSGAGYSQAKFKFKAFIVDGVVYIPNQDTHRKERNVEAREMVRARYQPPADAIEYVYKA